eukprot:Blabericola_migrator_1__358@NODE_108_length_14046_cov_203_246656_g96_i0_p8_GENE_NODE_108_length_14046_cov_203_246656_g96_i0NODE_108_length_14046_cov_203_246656_g96_i0_p8_ORF_typecomplete_len111_score8_89_NODE_108_length_14046_cov_203_246656_g96_i0217549
MEVVTKLITNDLSMMTPPKPPRVYIPEVLGPLKDACEYVGCVSESQSELKQSQSTSGGESRTRKNLVRLASSYQPGGRLRMNTVIGLMLLTVLLMTVTMNYSVFEMPSDI